MLAVYAGLLILIAVVIGAASLKWLTSGSDDRLAVIGNLLSLEPHGRPQQWAYALGQERMKGIPVRCQARCVRSAILWPALLTVPCDALLPEGGRVPP